VRARAWLSICATTSTWCSRSWNPCSRAVAWRGLRASGNQPACAPWGCAAAARYSSSSSGGDAWGEPRLQLDSCSKWSLTTPATAPSAVRVLASARACATDAAVG
jgi:hypothetical protein